MPCFNAKPVRISHAIVFRGEETPLNVSQRIVSTLYALNMKHDCRRLSCSRQLTLRRLMSYIYIYMEHLFLMFLDHTQRRTTVGRTPLDE